MNQILARLYPLMLCIYPQIFHMEFGAEMQSVFAEVIIDKPAQKSILLFLRELVDLPASVFRTYIDQWFRGDSMPTQAEYLSPSTRWQAFIGTLPFLAFGIASMISKTDLYYPPRFTYPHLAFYSLALIGLLIGWIREFPLWSYSYLGWSLVFAWWWTGISIYGTNWGYRVWLPFGIMVLLAFLLTRSLSPIKKFFRDIWNDWTRLPLAMYTFIAFVYLIYDENHHPYLFIFMAASTLSFAAGAWLFLRSASLKGRVASIFLGFLFGGYVSGMVISRIYGTWDWRAYYGLPEVSTSWYLPVFRTIMVLSFYTVIIFWPALIALIRRLLSRPMAHE